MLSLARRCPRGKNGSAQADDDDTDDDDKDDDEEDDDGNNRGGDFIFSPTLILIEEEKVGGGAEARLPKYSLRSRLRLARHLYFCLACNRE